MKAKHLNEERPDFDIVVLCLDGYGSCRLSCLNDASETVDIDMDEYDNHDAVWWDDDCEEYFSLDEYPFWINISDIEIPEMSDYKVKRSNTEGYSIPGYKIVNGTVVKA